MTPKRWALVIMGVALVGALAPGWLVAVDAFRWSSAALILVIYFAFIHRKY